MPDKDIKSSAITFSLAQMGTILTIALSGVAGGAVWATKVNSQLNSIEKSVASIETSLKEIKASDASQDLRIQGVKDKCCRHPGSDVGEHWLNGMSPAILPDNRRRVVAGSAAVATGGFL